jgi:hypothetical protein
LSPFTESTIEETALEWLKDLGYTVVFGGEIAPGELAAERENYGEVILSARLKDALKRINPSVPTEALEDAYRKVTRSASVSLVGNNSSSSTVCRWRSSNSRTPPMRKATIWSAFNQLQTYKHDIPALFHYNELLIISDGLNARIGSLTANKEWFLPWKTIEGESTAPPSVTQLEVLLKGRVRETPLAGSDPLFHRLRTGTRRAHAQEDRRLSPVPRGQLCAGGNHPRFAGKREARLPIMELKGTTSNPLKGGEPATGASAWSGTPRARGKA